VSAFGEKLRKQREQRGISLDAISNTTKISPRMLRAIEDEHFDQLPGGVFNKGFVRAYARQVGLDEEETVSDYLAALRESQVQSQTILPNFRDRPESIAPEAVAPDRRVQTEDRRKEARRSQDREAGAAEAHPHGTHAGGVPSNGDRHSKKRAHEDQPHEELHEENVDGAAYPSPSFLNLSSNPSNPSAPHPRSHGRPEQFAAPAREAAGSPPRRVPWEKLAVALLVVIVILALWTFLRRGQSPSASQPDATHAPTPSASGSASAKPSATAVTTKQAVSPQNSSPETSPDADINPPVSKSRPHVAAVKPTPTLTLLIRADQTCWVAISADGQAVATETLIAPAHTSVRAAREITVKAGNSAGISFQLNGKEIQVQGNPGEVRTFAFDATGMRTSMDAQPAHPPQ
jgi:cytoskeletal protein RodZ